MDYILLIFSSSFPDYLFYFMENKKNKSQKQIFKVYFNQNLKREAEEFFLF